MPSDYAAITSDNIRRRGEEFDDIGRLVSEQLYSDRTHFVYELLQNAEDALARRTRSEPSHDHPHSVTFSLTDTTLSVSHFGQPFSTDDVRGISDVLRGTKTNDTGQIGRFGIGFKSVYAFTDSPQISSGDEHFQIERYIRVYLAKPSPLAEGETRFIFPLRHTSVTAVETFKLIEQKLRGIGPRVLLFLHHIDTIKWTIRGGTSGQYRRESAKQGVARRVTVFDESNGKRQSETWLLFDRAVHCPGRKEPLTVSVAYLVERDERTNREQIKPITGAPLVVYFPTDRETRLGFLINGPYLTTPARDNILSDPLNAQLLRETGALIVETLEHLKSLGMLTASTLRALPITASDFGPSHLFRPIFDAVLNALITRELLPAHGGGFVSARYAKLARSSELRDLLSNEQLPKLFQATSVMRWLSEEITFDRMPELRAYLMQELKVQEVTPEVFANQIDHAFLEKQPNEWLIRLYTFLDGQPALWRAGRTGFKAGPLRTKPIIRLQSGNLVAPFTADGIVVVFLPPLSPTMLPTVHRVIAADAQAIEFLRRLPLTLPDLVAEVMNHVLPKYECSAADRISTDEHERDVTAVIEALRVSSAEQVERLLERLRQVSFFLATNAQTGQSQRKRAGELYLPLVELKAYFVGNPVAWFLSTAYEAVYQRLEQIGVSRTVRVKYRSANAHGYVIIAEQYGHYERGQAGFDPDCTVDGLEFALSHPTIERAAYIWNEVLPPLRRKIYGYIERATKANYRDLKKFYRPSNMGRIVTEMRWLPARGGGWAKPSDLSLNELPHRFQHDEHLAATLAMKNAIAQSQVEQALGFRIDPEDVDFLKQHWDEIQKLKFKHDQRGQEGTTKSGNQGNESFDYAETLREIFQRPQVTPAAGGHVQPRDVPYPEHRRGVVDGEIQYGQQVEPEVTLRFQQVERRVWEAKNNQTREFLAQQYGGECQICTTTFHKRDGAPYFEGLYLVSQTHKRWVDRPGNVLCLCATCCAKFLYGSVEADDILDQVAAFRLRREGGRGEPALTITLCENPVKIRFTEQHMVDLQELIKSGRYSAKAAD